MGAARIYRRATPYPSSALSGLDYTQSADLLYTVHIGYPEQKLARYGHTDWRWSGITYGPLVSPPTGGSGAATTPNTTLIHTQVYEYVITGITKGDPVQETRASATINVTNDLSLAGNYNTITLPSLGATFDRFVIYRKMAGAFGYVGNTADATFRDENILPVTSETPPENFNPFSAGAGYYPSSITLHQQRRTMAGSDKIINGVWMSRIADFENMDKSRPLRNDDSLLFALVSDKVNAITHLVSLKQNLMAFTGDGVWSINGGSDNSALTPGSIVAQRETGRGAARVKPLVTDDIVFYLTSKGRTMRALGFSFEVDGYKSDNVSIFSPHLFTASPTKRIVFQEEPYSGVWRLNEAGELSFLTWEQDQGVWGWSTMEIDGFVEDIAVIGELGYDRLYAIIKRTIAGVSRRFIERMALPHIEIADACHLDCSVSQVYSTPQSIISGLWHLEGQSVVATYDGFVERDLLVTNGRIVLPEAGTNVSVGLPYEATLETLPAALNAASGSLHTDRQQITEVVVRTIDSKGISIGVADGDLEQQAPYDGGDVIVAQNFDTTDYKVQVAGDWRDTSTVVVKQVEPLPMHVVGIFVGMNVSQ